MKAVELANTLQQDIFQQMQTSYPNEGGGFLLGHRDGDSVTVTEVIGVENTFTTEEQYHRYAMSPQNWMQVEDAADERGLVIVGYYHSHPDHPAIPSEYDREHALPNFVYIITSVQNGEAADMRAWLLGTDRSQFTSLDLSII